VRLGDLGLLYVTAGVACAVAIYRGSTERGARRVLAALLAIPLWPLWAPVALGGAKDARPAGRPTGASSSGSRAAAASARIDAALREGVEACAGTSLEALLPRDAATRIAAEVARAADRHAELEELLGREGFDPEVAEARLRELEQSGASPRAVSTARLHAENIRRLVSMREHDARALEELADLVQALRTQLVLARFAGSSVEGAGGIVSEVWARVEGLGVAMGGPVPGATISEEVGEGRTAIRDHEAAAQV
jgi:hypothetical protein